MGFAWAPADERRPGVLVAGVLLSETAPWPPLGPWPAAGIWTRFGGGTGRHATRRHGPPRRGNFRKHGKHVRAIGG